MAGMKAKTICKILDAKIKDLASSAEHDHIKEILATKTVVTGGCIASMLTGDPINDYDIYFRDISSVRSIANYYVAKFEATTGHKLSVSEEGDRVRIMVAQGYRGETAGDIQTLGTDEIDDAYEGAEAAALAVENDGKPQYRPVFLSTNAITLSNKAQLVLRFYGEPDTIHENYDFVHCTNYWSSWDRKLVLRPAALESLLSRELRYVGSKYPICSIIRLRKFIKRGWTINAGQILKMIMQINELDLHDPKVLEDQLTGVDTAFFMEVLNKLHEKDPDKINAAYLVEIIDRMF